MNNILRLLVLMLLSGVASAQVTMSTRFGIRSVNDPAYGAACGTETTGTTGSDSAAFQSAIDAANAAGGGTVYVPACPTGEYYYAAAQIYVKSGVLLSCQPGATIHHREDAAVSHTLSNSTGVVGFYGVSDAGIEGCAIDTSAVSPATNQANPIEVGSATPQSGAAWTGARSDRITIRGVTITTATKTNGPYSIWLHRADNIKVLGNTINGGTTSYTASTDQVGINIVASNHVEVAGNKLNNLGRAGIIVSAYYNANYAGYENTNINIHDNQIDVAKFGIGVFASEDTAANLIYAESVRVSGNHIKDPWLYGLWTGVHDDPASASVLFRNISFDGNVITMTDLTQNPYGMDFAWLANASASGFTVANNLFYGGKGADANAQTGLRLTYANNISFVGNSWRGGDTSTQARVVWVVSAATSKLLFSGNYFGQSNGSSWAVGAGDDYVLSGNVFEGWNAVTDAEPAINVASATARWTVVGNHFIKDPNNASNEGYLVDGTTSNLVGWTWNGNGRGWAQSFARQADGIWAGTCSTTPGNTPQFGCVTIATGAAAATVTHPWARTGTPVKIVQTSGDPVPARVSTSSGTFTVTLASNCTTADCTFYYDLQP